MEIKHSHSVEVGSEALFSIEGGVFLKPDGDGIRTIWQIPERPSQGMLMMLWVSLLQEVLHHMPESAPAHAFFVETLKRFEAMMKEGAARVLD